MRWISIVFVLLLFSCGPQKAPSRTEVVFECERDTLRISAVEYISDTAAIDSLKKENHLLRVEIDKLKKENKVLNALLKTSKSIDKLKKQLCDG